MVGDWFPPTTAAPILPSPDSLTLAQMAAQMVVVRTTGHLFDHEIQYPIWEADRATLDHYIQELGIGGVILLGGSAAEVGLKTQQLQSRSGVPLLVAADIEEGVGQRFSGATWFPPPMALDAVAEQDLGLALTYAEQMGRITAQEAVAIGLNWLLAPVVDVNNNPNNPVINVRAFGSSAARVQRLTQAFIRGARDGGVLTTAKHFPGHGDTALDSHLEMPVLPHSWERLQELEWIPFRGAIAAGVDSIMTAHLKVPSLDAEHPATLSAATLTGVLRQTLGFNGLIVTDALVMGAITRTYGPYEAAVMAVEAGADILLMPSDPAGVIRALVEAVNTGRMLQERLLASVERIWRAKQRVASLLTVPPESCHAWEHVPPPAVDMAQLAQPRARQIAADITTASMKIQGTLQPCSPQEPGDNIVFVDDVMNCPFLPRTAAARVLPQRLNYQFKIVDQYGCCCRPDQSHLRPTLVQLFVRGNPFRGSAASAALAEHWIKTLWQTKRLRGLVIYGSPYGREPFWPLLQGGVPVAFTYGQMPEAQRALLTRFMELSTEALATVPRAFTD
jgi:beta-glucosidase